MHALISLYRFWITPQAKETITRSSTACDHPKADFLHIFVFQRHVNSFVHDILKSLLGDHLNHDAAYITYVQFEFTMCQRFIR